MAIGKWERIRAVSGHFVLLSLGVEGVMMGNCEDSNDGKLEKIRAVSGDFVLLLVKV